MMNEINIRNHYIKNTIGYTSQNSTESIERPQSGQNSRVDTVTFGIKQETTITYSKTTKGSSDASDIAALKEKADKVTEHLRKLVEELILKQNKNYEASVENSSENILETPDITEGDIEAARQAISEDGEFGIKAVSDRLVDFAIAVSGGDKSKLSELISAIDEGFSAAKQVLGGELPDICQQTYDETMRKLNEWASKTDSE